ncbi:MAG TPA: hypothetical protein PL009_11330 [Flavipsychrobacter sp.]|nr:hypothetical protein [Flavipsychrobacter sp.]
MKPMLNVIFVLSALGLMITSCKKESTSTNAGNTKNVSPLRRDHPAANTNNPYDDYGFYHNILLDAALNDPNIDISHIDTWLPDYMSDNYTTLLPQEYSATVSPTQVSNACFTAIERAGNAEIDDLDLSQAVKDAMSNLNTTLISLSEDSSIVYADVKDEIISWEDDVIASSYFSTSEKQSLLVYSSIYRHSTYYWMDLYPAGRWPWGRVGGADALGGVIGLVGGPVMSWFVSTCFSIVTGMTS